MRRAQAFLVILTLLAIPVAVFAGANCCCQTACSTCAAMEHGKMAHCACPMYNAKCGVNGKTQLPDFSFASPLAPTMPAPFFRMAAPPVRRTAWSDAVAYILHGFTIPPFSPPRA